MNGVETPADPRAIRESATGADVNRGVIMYETCVAYYTFEGEDTYKENVPDKFMSWISQSSSHGLRSGMPTPLGMKLP